MSRTKFYPISEANRGNTSEYEEQSLAGSTAELIRSEEKRQSSRSLRNSKRRPASPTSDSNSLHLTNLNQAPLRTMPVLTEGNRHDAPIISLPYEVTLSLDIIKQYMLALSGNVNHYTKNLQQTTLKKYPIKFGNSI